MKKKIARWFWCGVLGELYGAAVESRFARDLPEAIDWVEGGDEPGTIKECSFIPQRLGSLRTRNSAAYQGLHALLMREGGQDFRTGDTIELQTYFDDSVDIHHVFPRSFCNSLGIKPPVYNSIQDDAHGTVELVRHRSLLPQNGPVGLLPAIGHCARLLFCHCKYLKGAWQSRWGGGNRPLPLSFRAAAGDVAISRGVRALRK